MKPLANRTFGPTIEWEEVDGNKWKTRKHTFGANIKIAQVLEEMKKQPTIRNIKFNQE